MNPPPGRGGTRWAAATQDRRGDIYQADGARFYDRLTASDPTEVRELLGLLPGRGAHVLDLAAGSGRLTVPLLAAGRRVTALDLSQDMLDLLRTKVSADPRLARRLDALRIVHDDMTAFDTGERYDAIVLGTTSVSLLDAAGRAAMLTRARQHLAAAGTLVVSTLDLTAHAEESGDTVRWLQVDGTSYEMVETVDPVALRRYVTVARLDPGEPAVWTTCTHVVSSAQLAAEAFAAGLSLVGVHPVAGSGLAEGRQVVLQVFGRAS